MYIWVIKRDQQKVGYDENAGHVIVAETEERVRAVAAEAAKDEGSAVWLSGSFSWMFCLGEADPKFIEGVALTSFNAG